MGDNDSSDDGLSFPHSGPANAGLLRTSASFAQIPGILREAADSGATRADVSKLQRLIAKLRSGPTQEECNAAADALAAYLARLDADTKDPLSFR